MRTNILFDLDGTLTDPEEGITNSVRYALERMGFNADSVDLRAFIGPPLNEGFQEFCGFEGEDLKRAVRYFRAFFAETGLAQNRLFKGIPELLQTLLDNGRTLYVATSKPTPFAHKVLERFDLARFFTGVTGSPLDHAGTPKAEIVRQCLAQGHIDPATAIMVGDRKHDILGAAACGLPSVGVLFGFGDRAEHEQAGATYIAEDIPQLEAILLSV